MGYIEYVPERKIKSIISKYFEHNNNYDVNYELTNDFSYFILCEKSGDIVLSFKIEDFPGCCGLGLIRNFNTEIVFSNEHFKPVENLFNVAFDICKEAGFTEVIFTHIENDNNGDIENKELEFLFKVFKSLGSKPINSFFNLRTSNEVTMFKHELYTKKQIIEELKNF